MVSAGLAATTEDAEHFWALLDPAHRRLLIAAGRTHEHPAGTILIHEGDSADSVIVLLSGRVKVIATGVTGHQGLLGIRTAGDVVGEMAAIEARRRSATVIAIDRLRLLRIPVADFVRLIRSEAGISYALLRVVSKRLRSSDRKRLESGESTTAQRVATALSELCVDHGVLKAGQVTISLPFSQEDLAMMVGASREAVVRALRELRAAGIIRTARRRITVLQPDALGRKAFGVADY
jgi:CRP-like cAMP-binding protein